VKDTVLDVVTGMILNSPECRRNHPIFGFADSGELLKISARANKDLADKGLDLSVVVKAAAESVGGSGNGQTVTAAASIPKSRMEEFLDLAEELVSAQLS
jgi:RecJ-like exonuclease